MSSIPDISIYFNNTNLSTQRKTISYYKLKVIHHKSFKNTIRIRENEL